ncbi:MAG: VWA domain-containing protein [Candidatus Acetothermia bacterium]|nr:VWA domain-containing protein [Candidatus Acetothermia bacterium]MDH7505304.1 VWA domain-containing protein [Candidatus Acetothermia bacterium]
MIRFSQPLALLGLLALMPLLWWLLKRRRVALFRGVALGLLLLALAEPEIASRVLQNNLYFAVDLSGSIARPREELLELVRSLMVEREGLRYGLILFGAEAAVDQGLKARLDLEDVSAVVSPDGTDLAAALELGLASLPKEGGRGIVLLSDGLPTRGDLRPVLARAAREGVKISVLPLRPRGEEVWLEALSLPEEVPPGAEFGLALTIGSLRAGAAQLLLYRDGEWWGTREVSLLPGSNRIELRDRLGESGLHRYRAYLVAAGDTIMENNSLEAITTVRGGPQILLLQSGAGGGTAELLRAAGYEYARASADGFVWDLLNLAPYRLVILDNLPLARLSGRAVEALDSYLQAGGGLLVIQGQRAVEGLRETGLERLLPISYEGREPAQAPSLAIVFVLDRSSSMTGKKIEFLREAAAASAEVLEERDLLGLLAFDTAHWWLFPLQPAEDKEPIYRQIAALEAGGGTDLYPALEEAFQKIAAVEAKMKHIIVFSDGKALLHELEFPQLLEQIASEKITVSAIAIGQDADVPFLRGLAEATGGQVYLVEDPEDLPRVTLQEVERTRRERWLEGQIAVLPGPSAALLGELGPIPPLGGYIVTYPKETSEVALLSEQDDPLVSFWSYGLGRAGVVNTDLEGRWSAGWLSWEGASLLMMQIVRRASGRPLGEELTLAAEVEGSSLRLVAEVAQDGRWANLLEVRGALSSAEGARELELEQLAPGRYETVVEDLQPGAYLVNLTATGEGQEISSATKAVTVPYPEEYRRIGIDELLLEEIAAATGGQYLTEEGLSKELLRGQGVRQYQNLRPVSLLLALFAFVSELVLRKLPWWGQLT